MFDLSYSLGKNLFGDDGFQNLFVYQLTLDTIEIKKDVTKKMLLIKKCY